MTYILEHYRNGYISCFFIALVLHYYIIILISAICQVYFLLIALHLPQMLVNIVRSIVSLLKPLCWIEEIVPLAGLWPCMKLAHVQIPASHIIP